MGNNLFTMEEIMGNGNYRVNDEKKQIEFCVKGTVHSMPIFDEGQKNDMLGKLESAGYKAVTV